MGIIKGDNLIILELVPSVKPQYLHSNHSIISYIKSLMNFIVYFIHINFFCFGGGGGGGGGGAVNPRKAVLVCF